MTDIYKHEARVHQNDVLMLNQRLYDESKVVCPLGIEVTNGAPQVCTTMLPRESSTGDRSCGGHTGRLPARCSLTRAFASLALPRITIATDGRILRTQTGYRKQPCKPGRR
jgi:hypothetical protein